MARNPVRRANSIAKFYKVIPLGAGTTSVSLHSDVDVIAINSVVKNQLDKGFVMRGSSLWIVAVR